MKKVVRTILALSVILTTFCLSVRSSQAKPFSQEVKQSNNSCDTAVENVKARIQNNNYLTVEFKGRQIPHEWQAGAPAGRSVQLIILLGKVREGSGQLVDNIMASTQMLTAMSNQLIEGCDNIAAVTYAKNNTGYVRTFGLIQGRVQEFDYITPDRGGQPLQLRWGIDMVI
ncbi:hypothetical protein [Laspinema olomoucense]|uniref:hypothetical protein n=1 Tax=Laspinema olomoucense TaxID=3231600 RepID=UPI0021BA9A06|nr:hypothetical protein [Laspinema sp. D3c]MCT7993460.1 hypothetical protein [Laspinema sp. D3c]